MAFSFFETDEIESSEVLKGLHAFSNRRDY